MITSSKQFFPESFQERELEAKLTEIFDKVLADFNTSISDVVNKTRYPENLTKEIIYEIFTEKGFDYIVDLLKTIENLPFNKLVAYLSTISLLKGHKKGVEVFLRLLSIEPTITEWYSMSPRGNPHEYDIIVQMNASYVPDIQATIDKIKIFSKNYVYPTIRNIDFSFEESSFSEATPIMAGFYHMYFDGNITERVVL